MNELNQIIEEKVQIFENCTENGLEKEQKELLRELFKLFYKKGNNEGFQKASQMCRDTCYSFIGDE